MDRSPTPPDVDYSSLGQRSWGVISPWGSCHGIFLIGRRCTRLMREQTTLS